ncbi:MAG TPA: radical SAM protein [Methylomirabilota bacterium]|nr:radical SAM protein [Methylomirabilota bacterium]
MGRAAVNGRAAGRIPVSALAAATVLRVDGRPFLYDARQNRVWETDEHGARAVAERRGSGDCAPLRLRYNAPARALIPRAIEFVMTGACNLQCTYCATRERYRSAEGAYDRLDEATALRALELLRPHLPAGPLQVKFFGGEPLLCVGVIRRIIETLDSWGVETDKIIATNGLLLDDETIDFLARGRFLTLISLDGVREVHDANRRDARGRGSYDRVLDRLNRFRERHPEVFRTRVAINMVVAPQFAGRFRELVAHLVRLGISPDQINPNDTAATSEPSTSYTEHQLLALRREKTAIRRQIVRGEWKSTQSIFADCYHSYCGLRPENAGQQSRTDEPPDAADRIPLEDCQGYAWNIVTILPDGKVSACLEFERSPEVQFGDVHEGVLDLARLIAFQRAFRESVVDGPCARCWAVRLCPMTGCYKTFVTNGCRPGWQHAEMCDLMRGDLADRLASALRATVPHEQGGLV